CACSPSSHRLRALIAAGCWCAATRSIYATCSLCWSRLRMIIRTVAWSIAVFVLAGLCEIGGGWLVWQAVREKRPSRWWIIPGVLLLAAYGFVTPGLLPDVSSAEFGRAFAVYGGIFIAMSLGWGAVFDGF
ncbi:unnamed protein product, partial [Ectocarpus sp. 8 AP-2014]